MQDVRGEQDGDRLLHARVAAERGEQDEPAERHGQRRRPPARPRHGDAGRADRRGPDGGRGRARGQGERADRDPGERAEAPDRAEPRAQHVARVAERRPERRPRRGRRLQDEPEQRGEQPGARRPPAARARQRAANAPTPPPTGRRARRAPPARAARPRAAGSSAPTASAIAANWSARTTANATDVTGPGSCPSSRSADGGGAARVAVADAEHEAAGDRVRVGGDDAVRRRVAAVAAARRAAGPRPRGWSPPGWNGVALLDLRAVGVVDAHRAERDLDRLAEAEDDLRRRRASSAAPRSGVVSSSSACAPAAGARASERREGEQRCEAAHHQASAAARPLRRGDAPPVAARHATTMQSAITIPRADEDRRRAAGRRRAAASRTACRRSRRARPPTSIGIRPVEDLRPHGLVGHLRRRRSSPSSGSGGRATRSARSCSTSFQRGAPLPSTPAGHVDVREAVVVEVVGLGVGVHLDGAVGEHARVGLVVVAERSATSSPLVLCSSSRSSRLSTSTVTPSVAGVIAVDLREVVRVALVRERGGGREQRGERERAPRGASRRRLAAARRRATTSAAAPSTRPAPPSTMPSVPPSAVVVVVVRGSRGRRRGGGRAPRLGLAAPSPPAFCRAADALTRVTAAGFSESGGADPGGLVAVVVALDRLPHELALLLRRRRRGT